MADRNDEDEDLLFKVPKDPTMLEVLTGSCICTLIDQPMRVSHILIELGYEPFAPSKGKSWLLFGKDIYFLPNQFSYACRLVRLHGIDALYVGFTPSVFHCFVRAYSAKLVRQQFDLLCPPGDPSQNVRVSRKWLSVAESLRQVVRESVVIAASATISQPFLVMSTRMIAELLNSGNKYSAGLFPTIRIIWSEEGLSGLFRGLLPHLLYSLALLWSTRALWFAVDRIKLCKWPALAVLKRPRVYMTTLINSIASRLACPLSVVATHMAISGSGLPVPVSSAADWLSAWDQLGPHGRSRGRSYFWRRYYGDAGTNQTIVIRI